MHYNYQFSKKGLPEVCEKEQNLAVTADCYCILCQKKTVKRSAQ